MEPGPSYPKEQIADELAVIVQEGIGRPLGRGSESDIPCLAAIARELAADPSLPLTRLIAEAIRPAIQRVFPARRMQAAARLLDAHLDKKLDDPDFPTSRVLLDDDRRPDVARLLAVPWTSYKRNLSRHEGRLREDVADQLLALLAAHRLKQGTSSLPAQNASSQPHRAWTGMASERLPSPRRASLVGVLLAAVLLAVWLIGSANRPPAATVQMETGIYAANKTRNGSFTHTGISAAPNDRMAIEVYSHNLEPPDSGRNALGVRFKVEVAPKLSRVHIVKVTTKALNTRPVSSSVRITTPIPTRLVLVPGSATRRHDIGTNARPHWVTQSVRDSAISGKTVVEPLQQPSNNFAETIAFSVRVLA